MYKILLSRTATKFLRKLDNKTKKRIKNKIKIMSKELFNKGSRIDIKQLSGSRDPILYRLRVGDYRIIFLIEDKKIKITEIMKRSKGYDWLN